MVFSEYSEAIDYLLRGQIIEEYMDSHNLTMTLEQYLNIAELQRARLFEKSTKIGAILARGNIHYQIQPLSDAMLRIGQAYAIRDDMLDVIEDIKWETYGCAAAISVSSMLSEMVKGKTIDESLKIKSEDIMKGLGDLPPVKVHCSLLGVEALQEAIYDYLKKEKKEIPEELEKAHEKNKKTLNHIEHKKE